MSPLFGGHQIQTGIHDDASSRLIVYVLLLVLLFDRQHRHQRTYISVFTRAQSHEPLVRYPADHMITCPTSTSYAESDHDPLHSYAQPHSSFSSEEDFDTARGLDFSVDAALSMKTKVSPARSTSSLTIASIVEQLERADCHFTDEVRRVQNDIDNARAEVRAWREARRLRELERIEKIERDT